MKFENGKELQTYFRKDIRQSGKSDFRWSASACFPVFIQSGINYPPTFVGFETKFCLKCRLVFNVLYMAGGSALKLENRYYI